MKNNIMSKEASRATSLILTFVMLMCMFLGVVPNRVLAAGTGNTYYVDSINGSDSNNGTNSVTAWKTLDKVNNKYDGFTAGDKIYLAAGSSWIGQLAPKGSGADGSPIVIDMYDPTGTGIKPRIDANGTVDAAMRLDNQEYWEINNLELTNNSTTTGDLRGVYVTAENYGTADHIYVSNCYIHDVKGSVKTRTATGLSACKRNGGIIFDVRASGTSSDPEDTKTNFNDILIYNNHLKDTSMIPIAVWQNDVWGWLTRSSATDTDWYPNTNVVYRNNYVEAENNIYQGSSILMYSVKNGLAEYNTVNSGHTSGIETGLSDNVIFQYNEIGNVIKNATTGSDSCAIDQDEQTTNATFQYNYLHDSGVGLLLYGLTFGSNFTFRYNIMQDFTKDYMQLYQQNNGGTAEIYNNVLYNSTAVSVPFTEPNGSLTGGSATIKNNIFYGLGTFMSRNNITYDYNTYYGMTTTPTDAHKITSDPKFVNGGTGETGSYSGGPAFSTVSGYQLQPGSPCINAGTSIASNGGIDFAGKAIYKGLPDMGTFEYTVDANSTILTGYTKDPYGNVVNGATVSVTAGGSTYSGTSDTSGFYSIEGIPTASVYTVNATKSNYQNASVPNVTVVAGDITKQDITMTSLSTSGSISGTVTDYSGNVLSGATVTTTVNSQNYSAATDAQGVYTINNVPIGAANAVIASKSGYASGQAITTVQPGNTVNGVNISLTKLNPPVYYANDNFDNLTAGTSLASGSTTAGGWKVSLGNASSYVKAESVTGATGNALHMYKVVGTSTSTTQTGISKTGLNLTGIVTVEARISTDETSATKTYWSIPIITDSSATPLKAASINVSGGTLSSYIGGTNTLTGVSLSNTSRVWHTIRVVLNTNSKTYSLYIDDMNTPLTGFNNVSFREAATNINTVNFYADSTNGGNVYIDYAKVNSDLPYANNDTDLSSLKLSSGSLTQLNAFGYKAEDVPNFIDKVTVTPTADSTSETIKVNGTAVQSGQASQEISLNEGDNTINVETTAEDGTTKQNYTISVYRVPSDDDGFLKSLALSQGTLNPSFDYDVYDYNVSVPYETNTITLQPTASVSGSKIYVNNALVVSGQISQSISLNPGDNTIDVVVSPTSGAGAYGKSYKIIVNRDANPNPQAPVITLAGLAIVNIANGANYTDLGVTISDNIDTNLTSIVTYTKAGSSVAAIDTSVAGTYIVHYNVKDTENNAAAEVTRTVIVANAVTPPPVVDIQAPAEVTGANVTAGNGQLAITWTDPTDSDFDHVEISGVEISTQTVNKGADATTITGLTNGSTYNITLKTVDVLGNRSTGVSASGTPVAPNNTQNEIKENITVKGPGIDSTATGTIFATVPKSVTSQSDLDLLNPIEFTLKITTSGGVQVTATADEYVDWTINGNVATTAGAVQYFSNDYELQDPFEYEFKVTIDELTTVDKNGLQSAIADAINKLAEAVEGIAAGQYKVGSKDILNNAINAAQGVYDDDATQTQVNDAITALRVAITNFENSKVGSVKPPAPSVTRDDTINKVYGMASGIEYNLDGAGYVAYDAATFNAINFSGNHMLLVRVAAEGNNPAGLETILTFTTNPTTSDSSDDNDDDSDDDGDSNYDSNSSSVSNNGISSNTTSIAVDAVRIEKIEGGMIKLVKANGQAATGWHLVDGNWYLADTNGIPKIGWQQMSDGNWYLLKLDNNGAMATGWQQAGNK